MRLTLVLFLTAWLQIYGNSAVLSLPPSLIAKAASIRQLKQQQQQRQEQQVWPRTRHARAKEQQQAAATAAVGLPLNVQWPMKKDAMAGVDGSFDSNRVSRNSNIISNSKNNLLTSNRVMPNMKASAKDNNNNNNNDNDQQQQQARNLYKLPNEYEINSLLANAAEAAAAAQQNEQQLLHDATELATDLMPQQQQPEQQQSASLQSQSPSPPAIAARTREIEWNEFFTPMKYWARHCQPTVDDDCPAKYAMQQQQNMLHAASNRNKAAALDEMQPDSGAENEADAALSASNDILTLLNGEDDLIKFLHWAMQQLQPYHSYENLTRDGVSIDMNLWKKLNLSGQREPLLYVEEPRYVIVRREPNEEENFETRLRFKTDPFIPPRGRKYQQMPELEKLLHRYEQFVPNRGKRDKIKDIFKYDDLFFPNRGKKQKPTYATIAGMRQQNDVAAAEDDDDDEDINVNGIADVVDTSMLPSALWPLHKLWRSIQEDCLQHGAVAGANIDINGGRRICYNNKMHDVAIDDDVVDDNDDDGDAWPRTSTSANDVKKNEYDQSVKTSMPTTGKEKSTAAGAIKYQQKQQRQWSNNKAKMLAMAKAMAANRPRRVVDAAAIDGIAANRLHATRSMSTMQQLQQQQQQLLRIQQQPRARYLPTTATAGAAATANRHWLGSTKFSNNNNNNNINNNWELDQQLQNKQHLMQQQQLSTQQQPYPLKLRHFQLLASNGARQSPPETQLAAMDMWLQQNQQQQQLQQQLQQPATFIDNADDADIDYFFNNDI